MKPTYTPEKGMNIDGNFWMVHPFTGEAWDNDSVDAFIEGYEPSTFGPSLDELKQQGVLTIKAEAAKRITALDWQLQRANDRFDHAELAGEEGATALAQAETELVAVLEAREAIRVASNDAEAALLALDSEADVDAFVW